MTDEANTDQGDANVNPDGQQGGDQNKPAFTAEQQAELNRIVAREKKAAADKARTDAKAERDAADAEARKAKDADDAKKAGDFEKVEGQLRTDLTTVTGERDTLTAEVARWRELASSELEAELKALPASLRALDPGGDDLFARRAWIGKAKKAAGEIDTATGRGNGANPPGSSANAPTLDQTKREMAAIMGIRR